MVSKPIKILLQEHAYLDAPYNNNFGPIQLIIDAKEIALVRKSEIIVHKNVLRPAHRIHNPMLILQLNFV